jgi:hypothetical protein
MNWHLLLVVVGICVFLWVTLWLLPFLFDPDIEPFTLLALAAGLFVVTVIWGSWALTGWLSPHFPMASVVVTIGEIAVVGFAVYQVSPLKVMVYRRRSQRRLRALAVIDEHDSVSVTVQGRVRQLHGPRRGGMEGLVHELCPATWRLKRIELATTSTQIVVTVRPWVGRRSTRSVPRCRADRVTLQRERVISLYRLLRATTGGVDFLRQPKGLVSDEFTVSMTDGSSVVIAGGPPSEIDHLQQLLG